MDLIEKNLPATSSQLRIFGVLLAIFFGLVGGLVLYHTSSWILAYVIWSAALVVCVFYYTVKSSQPLIFRAWMAAVYPIGWFISHMLLALIYYLVITPIGLIVRLCKRDPLQREFDRSATTYWMDCRRNENVERYFQQF